MIRVVERYLNHGSSEHSALATAIKELPSRMRVRDRWVCVGV